MRYPVGLDRDDFLLNWYCAQGYSVKASYGYHEGVDLNLRTGGDTDLGQPLYAIADGTVEYWHVFSHPWRGFGVHLMLRVEGAWGVRWAHYAHCLYPKPGEALFTAMTSKRPFPVREGQVLARLGNTGRPRGQMAAHLHFAVLKVDPCTLRGRPGPIDAIAHTREELETYWEDPLEFLTRWVGAT